MGQSFSELWKKKVCCALRGSVLYLVVLTAGLMSFQEMRHLPLGRGRPHPSLVTCGSTFPTACEPWRWNYVMLANLMAVCHILHTYCLVGAVFNFAWSCLVLVVLRVKLPLLTSVVRQEHNQKSASRYSVYRQL